MRTRTIAWPPRALAMLARAGIDAVVVVAMLAVLASCTPSNAVCVETDAVATLFAAERMRSLAAMHFSTYAP